MMLLLLMLPAALLYLAGYGRRSEVVEQVGVWLMAAVACGAGAAMYGDDRTTSTQLVLVGVLAVVTVVGAATVSITRAGQK